MREFEDKLEPAAEETKTPPEPRHLATLAIAALGVVYGDIGTSPLYAVRECFYGSHPVSPERLNILGVLSLIVWSLIIVISVKYLSYVLRADNRGEGGILALMALVHPAHEEPRRRRWILVALGLFGAALLYGDGTITPAISVLSAVEGLEVATPVFKPFVVPIAASLLVLLFLFQRRGTGGVGAVFGPIMMLWFTVLAVLGAAHVFRQPGVLVALNPLYAVRFLSIHGWYGFLVLGAVVLVVTGGEALYADMGHFGKRTIRLTWYGLVLPALLLNYFGQGALLLDHPEAARGPFYLMAPGWALYPLVVLATVATIIASQAIISGAFSLTRQAIQLGYNPRMRVVHTSREEIGQVYLPGVNWMLMVVTVLLVLTFQRSTNLAAAYGVAVTTTMVITTLIAYVVSREIWGWGKPAAIAVTAAFLVPDLSFFSANIIKVEYGGWVPILIALAIFLLMSTWHRGRGILAESLRESQAPVERFLADLRRDPPGRVDGTGVFLSGTLHGVPLALSSQLEHLRVLHEQVVLLTVMTRSVPFIPSGRRVQVTNLGDGLYRVVAYYGFMQSPRMRVILRRCERAGLKIDVDRASFFAGRQIIIPSRERGMTLWRARLFAFISRNSLRTSEFFHIPHDRLIEIGVELEV